MHMPCVPLCQVTSHLFFSAFYRHLDYLELDSGGQSNHDFDSSGEGTNR